ncbi:MAG: hypothetical protein ACOYBC_03680 [Bilifractor sp.]|jgi:hypothetical protein
MKTLYQKLKTRNPSQTLLFTLISTLNMVIVGVFLKLILEVGKIRSETKIISHDQEMMGYLMILIAVSVMTIFFSVWIMQIICRTVFQARKDFNIQVRLLGLSGRKLTSIYVREFLGYQKLSVPAGGLLAEVSYFVLSGILEIDSRWIPAKTMMAAVMIHLITVLLCLAATFGRASGFDPLRESRSEDKSENIRRLGKSDVITGIIGAVLIVIGISHDGDNSLFQILPMVGIFLNLDLIVVSLQYFLKWLFRVLKLPGAELGQRQLLGEYKRMNPILSTLMVGVMISFGLLGMFETIRGISRATVEQNIYFQELLVNSSVKQNRSEEEYREMAASIDPDAEIACGINLEMTDSEGYTDTVYAVGSDYAKYGEKMKLADGSDPSENLDSDSFDGIYLPDYFIGDDQIGDDYTLKIGENEITFRIAGRFVANGSRGRYGFISKRYLQKRMGSDMVNALYIHRASDELLYSLNHDENVTDRYLVTKDQLAANSYENAINGVEIFEIAAFMIILISFLMFVHFAVSGGEKNRNTITRLREIGVRKSILRTAYVYQAVSVFSIAFLLGIICARSFISAGVNMTLEFIDVPVRICFPTGTAVLVYLAMAAAGSAVITFTTRKAYGKEISRSFILAE